MKSGKLGVYYRIYYTFTMQLKNSYNVEEKNMYLMMMPLTIAGFSGTLIFVTALSLLFFHLRGPFSTLSEGG